MTTPNPVLTVFFEGTANPLKPVTTQVGLLAACCEAADITSPAVPLPAYPRLKMAFDGCGVTNGLTGVIFAAGLGPQCDAVAKRVRELLGVASVYGVVVNVLGLSRGGIAALKLAKVLAPLGKAVVLNMCVFDPVPGNLVSTTRYLDALSLTVASSVADVSGCHIARVLALYPHEPLPDLAFHAPILPRYPIGCDVEEDAMLGCHQGAFYPTAAVVRAEPALARSCALSYARVLDFMRSVGTAFDASHAELKPLSQPDQLAEMEAEVSGRVQAATYRAAHSKAGLGQQTACILRHASAPLLNQAHLALLSSISPDDPRVSGGWEGGAPRFLLEVCRPAGARSAK